MKRIFLAALLAVSGLSHSVLLTPTDAFRPSEPLSGLSDYVAAPDHGGAYVLAELPGSGLLTLSHIQLQGGQLKVGTSLPLHSRYNQAGKLLVSADGLTLFVETGSYLLVSDVSEASSLFQEKVSIDLNSGGFANLSRPFKALEATPDGHFLLGVSATGQVFALDIRDLQSVSVADVYENADYLQQYRPQSLAIAGDSLRFLIGNAPDNLQVHEFGGDGVQEPYMVYRGEDSTLPVLTEFTLSSAGLINLNKHYLGAAEYDADSSIIASAIVRGERFYAYDYGEGVILTGTWQAENLQLTQVIDQGINRGADSTIYKPMDVSQDGQMLAVSGWLNHANIFRLSAQGYVFDQQYTAPLTASGQACSICAEENGQQYKVVFSGQDNGLFREQATNGAVHDQFTWLGEQTGLNLTIEQGQQFVSTTSLSKSSSLFLRTETPLDYWSVPEVLAVDVASGKIQDVTKVYAGAPEGGGVSNLQAIGQHLFYKEGEYLPTIHWTTFNGTEQSTSCVLNSSSTSQSLGDFVVDKEGEWLVTMLAPNHDALELYALNNECFTRSDTVLLSALIHHPASAELSIYALSEHWLLYSKRDARFWLWKITETGKFEAVPAYFALSTSSPENVIVKVSSNARQLYVVDNKQLSIYEVDQVEGLRKISTTTIAQNPVLAFNLSDSTSNNQVLTYIATRNEQGKIAEQVSLWLQDNQTMSLLADLSEGTSVALLNHVKLDTLVMQDDGEALAGLGKGRYGLFLFEVNYPPVVQPVAPFKVLVGVDFELQLEDVFRDFNTQDVLTFTAETLPQGLVLQTDRIIGAVAQSGEYQLQVTATDSAGLSVSTQVPLFALSLPALIDQHVTLDEDSEKVIRLEGDTSGFESVQFVQLSAPAHGELVGEFPVFTYKPAENYVGSDHFSYKLVTELGDTGAGTITLQVDAINDAPVAQDDVASVMAGQKVSVNVLANDQDVDGDDLTILSALAERGSVQVVDGQSLRFTAPQEYSGKVVLTYVISDGHLQASASVTVSVQARVQPPSETDGSDRSGGSMVWLLLTLLTVGGMRRIHRVSLD